MRSQKKKPPFSLLFLNHLSTKIMIKTFAYFSFRTKGSIPEEHFGSARRTLLLEMTENEEREGEEEPALQPDTANRDEGLSQAAAASSER